MPDLQLLKCYLNGELVVAIGADSKTTSLKINLPLAVAGSDLASTPVDRVIFYTQPGGRQKDPTRVVLDVIPGDEPVHAGGSVVTVNRSAGALGVDLDLRLRVLIMGSYGSLAHVSASIGIVGGKIGILSLSVDGNSCVPAAGVPWSAATVAKLTKRWPLTLPDAGPVPLYGALGLLTRVAFGARSYIRFAETEVGSQILTPTLEYRFTLRAGEPAAIRLNDFELEWAAEEVAVAGLVNVAGETDDFYEDVPGLVRQSLWLDPRDLVQPHQSTTGKWLVNLTGFPSRAVIAAWNEYVVTPYLRSLHTLQAGRPVTGMPWLTQVDDLDSNAISQPTVIQTGGRDLEATLQARMRWEVGLLVIDRTRGEFPLSEASFATTSGFADPQRLAVSLAWLRPMIPPRFGRLGMPSLPVVATLSGCLTHKSQPVQLMGWIQPVDVNPSSVLGFSFKTMWDISVPAVGGGGQSTTDASGSTPANYQFVRIGSLDLVVPAAPPPMATTQANAPGSLDQLYPPPEGPLWNLYYNRTNYSSRPPDLVYSKLALIPNPEKQGAIPDSQYSVSFSTIYAGPRRHAASLAVNFTTTVPVLAVAPGGQDPEATDELIGVGSAAPGETDAILGDRRFSAFFQREPTILVGEHRPPIYGDQPPSVYIEMTTQSQSTSSATEFIALKLNSLIRNEVLSDLLRVRDLVVLDRHPFLVAKMRVPLVRAAVEGDSQELALWDSVASNGFRWRIRTDDPNFILQLPPQGIGEQMEKSSNDIPDAPNNAPIDFRFSPAAKLQLRASGNDSQFVVAPWDLRRIFEGAESESPELTSAEFELLYGMALRIQQPGLHIAEMQLLQGALPGELSAQLVWNGLSEQSETYLPVRADWANDYNRMLSRMCILEPWLVRGTDQLTLADATFVQYQLRPTADLKYPVDGGIPPPNSIVPPHPNGLGGGFAWGFPFSSVYEQVWKDPKSSFGVITRPYLSSLGGWGYQKGTFANETVSIIGDTSMGRTSFYSLEILGRIGVFWNRAKHVIIYQRTVAPSEQFAGEQDQLLGRPILRKVEEYVEILVPVAQYGQADALDKEKRARGCLLGIHFKSLRIHVDSAWGGDVYDHNHDAIGYQIPLWNRGASDSLPNVYPLPHILFEFASDPAVGSPSFLRDILDPEKLRFFHSTRTGDKADTDAWPSVERIDFLLKTRPDATGEGTTFAKGKKLKDGMDFVPPKSVADGYDQLTWHVAATDVKAHLTVDRPGKVVSAVLKTVLTTRPIPATLPTAKDPPNDTEQTSDVINQISQSLTTIGNPNFADDVKKAIKAVANALPTSGTIPPSLYSDVKNLVQSLRSTAANTVKDLAPAWQRLTSFEDTLSSGKHQVFDEIQKVLNPFSNSGNTPTDEACYDALSEVARRISRALPYAGILQDFEELRTSLGVFQTGLNSFLATQNQIWNDFTSTLNEISKVSIADLNRLKESASSALNGALAQAQAALSDVAGLAAGVGYNAQSVVDLQTISTNAIADFNNGLKGAVAGLASLDLQPVLAQFATLSTQFVNALGAPLKNATTDVGSALKTLNDNLNVAGTVLPGTKIPMTVPQVVSDYFCGEWYNIAKKAIDGLTEASDKFKFITTQLQELQQLNVAGNLKDLLDKKFSQLAVDLNARLATILSQNINSAIALASGLTSPALALLKSLDSNALTSLAEVQQFAQDVANINLPTASLFQDASGFLTSNAKLPPLAAIVNDGDRALQLLRAFGDVPEVPALSFNGDQLGYYFDALNEVVETSPVLAMIARPGAGLVEFAEDKLKALGLRLPTDSLGDGIIPSLDDLTPDLSEMFPDFAGLKLDNLFSGLKIPDDLKDHIKVSHGIDPQSLRAWIKVDVVFDITGQTEIFSFGPITLSVLNPHFESHSSLQADATGQFTKTTTGLIRADWLLNVASMDIVTLVATSLTFDQTGRIHVDIKPQNIQLNGLLQMISDAVDTASGDSDGGFSYQLVQEGGFPVGVEVLLDLVLPPVQEGPTGISNLRLMTSFELVAAPDFAIGIKFGLGRPDLPFTITVFILGGAGAIIVGARYYPFSGKIAAYTSITLAASASLAISFGPINGMVAVYLGFTAEFYHDLVGGDGSDNKLVLTAFIELYGEVDLAGIISVSIEVRLSLTYDGQAHSLTGTGSVSISITICWCFSIDVSVDISMTFDAPGQQSKVDTQSAAQEHVGMSDLS